MTQRTIAAVVALALSLIAEPVASQSSPTDDAVLKRIWSLGIDSSHVEPLAGTLLDSIGPRLTGSPNLRAAQRWLVKTYRSWGIEAKNERYGTWRGWRRGHSYVDLLTPRFRTLEATMVAHSPGTHGRKLIARTIVLPRFADSAEFVRWLPRARGKLVLVSAPLPTCRPTADWAQWASPEARAGMDSLRTELQREWFPIDLRGTGYSLALGGGELGIRLEKAGVAGLLTSRPKDAWGTREVFETFNKRAPVVSLSCEDYGLVFRLTERGDSPRLRLDLDSRLLGERPVFNTIATIPGTEKPNEYVVLSAHFDSWDGGSGATDNGAGSIVMLEAMRILARANVHPRRTILVGHWTGEEVGLVGSHAFAEDHPAIVRNIHFLLNQDNGTGRVTRLTATGLLDADVHLRAWLDKLPAELRAQIEYAGIAAPGRGGTDDFSFYCLGVPAAGVGAVSWSYGNYTWHTERDTYDKLVFDELASKATLTAMLAYLASEDPERMSRARIDLTELAARTPRSPTAPPPDVTWPSCGAKAPRKTRPRLR
jgi:carboxypeptidase Q